MRQPSHRTTYLIASLLVAIGITAAIASGLDPFGPPPAGDPSEFTGPSIGEEAAIDFIATLPPALEGAFEGGATGTDEDVFANNVVPEEAQNNNGAFDIPTGGKPSPLVGVGEFEQKMLRFEEFGQEPFANLPAATLPFPRPTVGNAPEQDDTDFAASGPAGPALEAFLSQPGASPTPTAFANESDLNPWQPDIEAFLGRALNTPPAEGRPPGMGWAHQRFNEFQPQAFFKTAQAGARINGGFRDCRQLHGYGRTECGAAGITSEFAPGGLYHVVYENDLNSTQFVGTTAGLPIQFHPNLPIQDHKTLWTFDGTLPPKLLMGRYGEAIMMRHYNALPIDPAANRGFGLHTLSTHEHNGHNPAESDGYTNAFFFPGQFYDYRWPMQLAGYDTINTLADEPKAAFPCAPGETLFVNDEQMTTQTCDANGRINIRGDWRETMSTHWFHDHMLDFTAQNVYKGNAAMFNFYSALDRGHEAHNDGVNLNLPSGTALPWGNRDYDVNLVLADKAWDFEGQLWFNIFNLDGFMGDQILTNWLYKPYFEVRARRYRFRILNGSVSRYFAIALVKQVQGTGGELAGPAGSGVSYDRVPFHMIANDGNIMEHAIAFDGASDLDGDGDFSDHHGILPTQAIAERYDIIVDFAAHGIVPGDKLYFVNILEHDDGKGPKDHIPLADVLSEAYLAITEDDEGDGVADRWINGDPAVGRFLEFRVEPALPGGDPSLDPTLYEPGGLQMIPLPLDRNDPQLANAIRREFDFGRSNGTDKVQWTIKTDGGAGLGMDPRRLSAAPELAVGPTQAGFDGTNGTGFDTIGTLEIWDLQNGGGGWAHPIHIHFEEAIVLTRDGAPPPLWETWARKDVFRVGPEDDSSDEVQVAIRFREFAGTYMEHCHNTQHEDHAMLLRWDVEHPGQVKLMPTPIPTWDGVEYVDSHALPTFRTGDGIGPEGGGGGMGTAPSLIIDRARFDTGTSLLRVRGESEGSTSVILFEGVITNGDCEGEIIAVEATDAQGEFEYREATPSFDDTDICITASNGAIATDVVEID